MPLNTQVICSGGCTCYSISRSPQISHLFCSSVCNNRAPGGSLTLKGFCCTSGSPGTPSFQAPTLTSPSFKN